MIHQIFSKTLDSFKTLDFQPGCNLLVAEKTRKATDMQTRNCAGKSSVIEIVHFLLGSDADRDSIFLTDALRNHAFGMTFDLAGSRIVVERCGGRKNEIVIHEAHTEDWPIQPNASGGNLSLRAAEWRTVLGNLVFGIQQDLPKHSPTFRLLFPYFARWRRSNPRGGDDGFLDPVMYSKHLKPWQPQVAVSCLLGLNWEIPREIEEVRLKEQSLKKLKKELTSGIFSSIIGSAAQLKSRATLAEKNVAKLRNELAEFRVLPQYHELEREAADIAVQVAALADENTLDQENLDRLREELSEEQPPSDADVTRMYDEAGIVLSSGAIKRLNEVRVFREAVVRNRRQHLRADAEKLEADIARRREEMQRLDGRRREIMETLNVHGALDQYTKLQSELTRLESKAEELRRHHEVAQRVETSQTDLVIERAQLQRRLQLDHSDHDKRIERAVVLFEELSHSLCEHEGTLSINPTERGPEIDIRVEGYRGKGVRQMQVFCFDLMLSVLLAEQERGPRFLIHDSHLFDGMDPRQIGKALRIGAQMSAAHHFQYIVTLNSNTLEEEDVKTQFDPEPFVLPVRLTDATETGGLFGFRFD